jgi:hypothetical protein
MKNFAISVLLVLGCIGLLVGCTSSRRTSDDGWNEKELVGTSYDDARSELIRHGWLPRTTSIPGPFGPEREWLTAGDFLALGYIEIEQCSGTGVNLCAFNFVRENGRCLRVVATGEPKAARVTYLVRECASE